MHAPSQIGLIGAVDSDKVSFCPFAWFSTFSGVPCLHGGVWTRAAGSAWPDTQVAQVIILKQILHYGVLHAHPMHTFSKNNMCGVGLSESACS